jgi:nitrogen fixation/metabolism regulation signal transduction histidine kinase
MGLTTQKNYRFLLYFYSLIIVFLGMLIAGWAVIWLFPSNLGEGYHNVQALLREIQKILVWRISLIYTITSLIIVLAMVVLHLLYSHKIAGPVYRIGLEATKIAKGNLAGNIRFRKHDNLMDMADLLNLVAAQYRGKFGAVKDCIGRTEEQIHRLNQLVLEGAPGSAVEKLSADITKSAGELEQILSEIRT